ncbi:hypothetical protein J6590_090868 [Homalodisca vitripennis]|nr:hypothetical protein J6590_090868 [Homalodisca vitripennis]
MTIFETNMVYDVQLIQLVTEFNVRCLTHNIENKCYRCIKFLEGQAASSHTRLSNNRSVMPLDVLGHTRAILKESACLPWLKGPGFLLKLLPRVDYVPAMYTHHLSLLPIESFSEVFGLGRGHASSGEITKLDH